MSRRSREHGPTTRQRRFDLPATLGVIADTHIYPSRGRELPDGVLRLFERADLDVIVHLGDVNASFVLESLAEVAPVIAVAGNNDDMELHITLPERTRIFAGEWSFGALHGHGGKSARAQAIDQFQGKVDCILFGHSHKPLIEDVDGTILFNPGSPTDRRWNEHFGIGLIHVTAAEIHPDLILFTDPDHLDNVNI